MQNIVNLKSISNVCLIRKNHKFDMFIVISGFKGMGKSTFLIILGRLIDPNFDLKKNMGYTRDDINTKPYNLLFGSFFGADEGARAFYRRDWNKKEQKETIKKLLQIRHKGLTVGICIQDFITLDNDIKNMIDMWIFIPARGHGMIFTKTQNPMSTAGGDLWHITENAKLLKKYYKGPLSGTKALINALRRTTNYYGEIHYPPLSQNLEEEFIKISEPMKEIGDDAQKPRPENKWKERLISCIKKQREDGWSINKIAKYHNMNPAKISNILNDIITTTTKNTNGTRLPINLALNSKESST